MAATEFLDDLSDLPDYGKAPFARAKGDFIHISDALFIVAAILAVFAGGLLVTGVLTREAPAATVEAGGGREVSLGAFHFGMPGLFKPQIVEFEAIAVVGGSPDVQDLYEERLKTHSARISQAVEEAGRAATDAELDDPALVHFRGRIQGKLNGVLGTRAVQGVLIDDFRSMEL
jgi:hypothetical protein